MVTKTRFSKENVRNYLLTEMERYEQQYGFVPYDKSIQVEGQGEIVNCLFGMYQAYLKIYGDLINTGYVKQKPW